MDFLKDELEGLPMTIQAAALQQLEQVIREARMAMTIHDKHRHDLTCQVICAKISSVLDFVSKFRQVTDTSQG